MTISTILKEVQRLKKRFHESDPFLLAEALGIFIIPKPMGREPGACKGFFTICNRIPMIVINSDLSQALQQIICAHELGHAVLHACSHTVSPYTDFGVLTREASGKEYEANVFAAELLLDDDKVMEHLQDGLSFYDAAPALGVPADLLAFKLKIMRKKGYAIPEPPQATDSAFLKNVVLPGDELYE